MDKVLHGVRVLDFGRFIAGPYCASLLGQMGAEVIRIERPDGEDDRFIAPVTGSGEGGLFLQVNANKLGMTLNLREPEGKEILARLVKTADIVIANMPPKALRSLGLDYQSLIQHKPDIILVSNSTFGNQSPYADRPGFDGIGQVMSGAAYFTGENETAPVKTAVQYIDFATALAAALGTLAALMVRDRTGAGQEVSTSLLGTGLTISNGMLIEQAVTGINRTPTGNRSQIVAPSDLFETQDGHIVVQVVGSYIFKRLARLLGEESWLTDPRFCDDNARGAHSDVLCNRVAAWCKTRSTKDALKSLAEARVPSAPVLSFEGVLDNEQVQESGHLRPLPFPTLSHPAPVANTPFQLSKTAVGVTQRAPLVGEHTEQILAQLGYTAAEVEAFFEQRVV